jgi:hypothetical protein
MQRRQPCTYTFRQIQNRKNTRSFKSRNQTPIAERPQIKSGTDNTAGPAKHSHNPKSTEAKQAPSPSHHHTYTHIPASRYTHHMPQGVFTVAEHAQPYPADWQARSRWVAGSPHAMILRKEREQGRGDQKNIARKKRKVSNNNTRTARLQCWDSSPNSLLPSTQTSLAR